LPLAKKKKTETKRKNEERERRRTTLPGKLLKIHPLFCSQNDRGFSLYRVRAFNGPVRAIAATNDV